MDNSGHTIHPIVLARPRSRALLGLGFLALLCVVAGVSAERISYQSTLAHHKAAAIEDLNDLRGAIESRISLDVNLVRGLVTYVKANPDLSQAQFEFVATDLLRGGARTFRNLALAKDLIISHVHPIAGNEKALGLNYRLVEAQWPKVKETIDRRVITVAGPVNLVQGGRGLIARFPVFLDEGDRSHERLWGVVSTVIDFDRFRSMVNLDRYERDYRFRLETVAAESGQSRIIAANTTAFDETPVSLQVKVPDGAWRITAVPVGGWPARSDDLMIIVLAAGLGLLLGAVGVTVFFWLDRENVRARIEAERANRAKSEFLALMSHELRTPLNAISGFSEMIAREIFGPLGNAKYVEYSRDIKASGDHLIGLVNDILDLSKIEAGEVRIQPVAFAVRAVVEDTVRVVEAQKRNGAPNVDVDIPGDLGDLVADLRSFRQILMNLLSNAAKYTPADGRISVSANRNRDGSVTIRIADTGIGIPEYDIDRVLEPFGQSRANSDITHEGTGLGLALSKQLMELNGGTLSLSSKVGAGTVIDLYFPARNPA